MADMTDMDSSPLPRTVEASDQSSADGGGQQFRHFGHPPFGEGKHRRGPRLGEGKPVALELSDTAKRLVTPDKKEETSRPEDESEKDDQAKRQSVGRLINIEA